MKNIKEIATITGQPYATLQFWKRSGLLPPPVSRNGRTELFDDSVMARIQTILDFQSQGMSLENVAKALKPKDGREGAYAASHEGGRMQRGGTECAKMWIQGDCKQEICNLLSIDPAFTSEPSCYGPLSVSESGSVVLDNTAEGFDNSAPADVFLAISTSEKIYLARVRVVLHEQPQLIGTVKLSRKRYGHLLLCMIEMSALRLPTQGEVAFAVLEGESGRELLKMAEASEAVLSLGRKAIQALRLLDGE